MLGLLLATVIVAPWEMTFSVDLRDFSSDLRLVVDAEAGAETLNWLWTVSLLHQERHVHNRSLVRRLNGLSAALAVVTTVQSLLWIVAIGVR